jgi:S-ribosylhomocysteine lyase LuxS involved in autoinducer biosynthesis
MKLLRTQVNKPKMFRWSPLECRTTFYM